jgi:hypothetical protein
MFSSPARAKTHRSACRKFASRLFVFTSLTVCLFASPQLSARAQSSAVSNDIVISQVYARGGEPGATYRSDFVELFNRGATSVDLNNWAIEVVGVEGQPNTTFVISFATSNSVVLPGKHFLFEFARGTEGQSLFLPDFPFFGLTPNISGAGAHIAIYRKSPAVHFGSCPSGADLVDVVGFGTAVCREGVPSAPPAPDATHSLTRRDGGCTDTDDNSSDFQLATPNPRNNTLSPATPCGGVEPIAVQLSQSTYEASESDDHVTITVRRTGDASGEATVDYLTQTGTADARKDYTPTSGRLSFAPGETSKTVDVLLTEDGYVEGDENVHFDLIGSTGAGLGSPRNGTVVIRDNDSAPPFTNPIEDSTVFVRQHYHDFLNRAPDTDGLNFWIQNIEKCGADAQCREVQRVNTSAAFFLSIEFRQTGFLAYRAHRAAFASSGFEPMGMPVMQSLQRDQRFLGAGVVVGRAGWEQALEANTRAYFDEFIMRFDFRQLYGQMSNAQYVDALNANAAGALDAAERDALVNGLNNRTETRASVLRKIAENGVFSDAERNRAFVLMQYYGYLRRNPNEAPEAHLNFDGYNFWLTKLNEFNGNFVAAEMVKGFITSDEYRQRFAAN